MQSPDLTPAPLRNIPGLYPSVRRLPFPLPDAQALHAILSTRFPDADSRDYLDRLACGAAAPVRLFALSLLPPLLDAAGMSGDGCCLRRDANGRPFLQRQGSSAQPADFSLSHSRAHAACFLWVGEGRIGVDVEESVTGERAARLANRFLSAGECALLSDNDISTGFTRIWTRREALCKQDGGGQPLRFDSANFSDRVRLASFRLPDTGAFLTVCLPN